MNIAYARPAKERLLAEITALLDTAGLRWDPLCEFTVAIWDRDKIVATGSRHRDVLKCICTAPSHQGEGLIATVVSELIKDAYANGHSHLFLFTKPRNVPLFGDLGFHVIVATGDVALMENTRIGVLGFMCSLEQPDPSAVNGAVIANCNPFTNGHLFLVKRAAEQCDVLHLFILSEDRSFFPAVDRLRLAKGGTAHLGNVVVHPTGPYLISSATFPDYFIKDRQQANEINCRLDVAVFAECFAKPMNITKRFVGTEPECAVTAQYNDQLRCELPPYGIEMIEIPRLECRGMPVSASHVRELLKQGELAAVRPVVPPTTYAYLKERCSNEG